MNCLQLSTALTAASVKSRWKSHIIVTVSVTTEHIAKGEMSMCDKCPVALALMDATGFYDWHVDGEIAYRFPDFKEEYRLPKEVIEAIGIYDDTGKMKPFSFEMAFDRQTLLAWGMEGRAV